jgi:hypothetical protein
MSELFQDLRLLTKKGEKSEDIPLTRGRVFDSAVAISVFAASGWIAGNFAHDLVQSASEMGYIPDLPGVADFAISAYLGYKAGYYTGRAAQLTSILARHSAMAADPLVKKTISGFRSIFVNKKSAQDIYKLAHELSGDPHFLEKADRVEAKRQAGEQFWIVSTLDADGHTITEREMSDERYQAFKKERAGKAGILEEIRTDPVTMETSYRTQIGGAGLVEDVAYEAVLNEKGETVSSTWQHGEKSFDNFDDFAEAAKGREQNLGSSPSV